jgi:hypothetical protein
METFPSAYPPISLKSPADVLAAIPYLFGFHPADSVVVLGLRAKQVTFQVRVDLPAAADAMPFAKQLTAIVLRQHVTRALIVGYGSDAVATPAIRALRHELRRRRIDVPEALRATGGRYFSDVCRSPECCSPDGVPYDVTTSVIAATATAAGLNVVASRDDVAARLDPIGGRTAAAMHDAIIRADQRLCALTGETSTALDTAGVEAVDAAIAQFRLHGGLDEDEIAWLTLLLLNVTVRDYAWERVGEDLDLHARLWTYVVRRAEPELVAPPATLLAYASWRDGGGAIATIAVDRALAADPEYRMARYLAHAFEHGMSPTEYVAAMAS